MDIEQLQKLLNNSSNIKWSKHCLERMQERDISIADVKSCLQTGEVIEDNEIQIDESIFRKDYAPAHISEKYADELDYDLATDAIKYINEINNKEKKIMEVFV